MKRSVGFNLGRLRFSRVFTTMCIPSMREVKLIPRVIGLKSGGLTMFHGNRGSGCARRASRVLNENIARRSMVNGSGMVKKTVFHD